MSEREDYILRRITSTVKDKDSSAEIIFMVPVPEAPHIQNRTGIC